MLPVMFMSHPHWDKPIPKFYNLKPPSHISSGGACKLIQKTRYSTLPQMRERGCCCIMSGGSTILCWLTCGIAPFPLLSPPHCAIIIVVLCFPPLLVVVVGASPWLIAPKTHPVSRVQGSSLRSLCHCHPSCCPLVMVVLRSVPLRLFWALGSPTDHRCFRFIMFWFNSLYQCMLSVSLLSYAQLIISYLHHIVTTTTVGTALVPEYSHPIRYMSLATLFVFCSSNIVSFYLTLPRLRVPALNLLSL